MSKGFTGFIIVLVIVAAVVALFLKNTETKEQHPWELLPDTPDMVLETDRLDILFKKLTYDNNIWKSLTKTEAFKKLEHNISDIDIKLKRNKKTHDAFFSNKMLAGFYGDSNHIETVIVVAIAYKPNLSKLSKLFTISFDDIKINTTQKAGFPILEINNTKTGSNYYLGFAGEMMIASGSEKLIVSGLETFKNHPAGHFSKKPGFIKLHKTAGKKINTRLYFNGGGLKNLLKPFAVADYTEVLSKAGSLVQWTEADLFIKKSEIVLNGLSVGDSSSSGYQRLLKQKPQHQNYINILPSNTTLLIYQGFSNFMLWNKEQPAENNIINLKAFSKLIGPEVGFVSTARKKTEFTAKSFVFVRFNDAVEAGKLLFKAAAKSGKTAVKAYSGYKINKLKTGNLFEEIFGNLYGVITENYYILIDDYAVFGNSSYGLTEWIRYYESGKTLDLSNNFKPFADKLTERSNVTFFCKIRDFADVSTRFANMQTALDIKQNNNAIKDFEGLLFQMSSQPPFVYTSLFVRQSNAPKDYQAIQENSNAELWKVKLEDDIWGKPWPVKDHSTGKYNIIVFDKSSNIYLISNTSSVLWKKQIDGLPESDVFQVDYYKNGKIQYLFNTTSKIYLIDKNGNFVKHYPIKITPSITNGLSVFDYNRKKDYRLILAQSDKRIYNYDLKGKKIRGWDNFKMPDVVVRPIQRLIADNKDYIIVTDIKNNIRIVNRRGKQRIHIKGQLNKAVNSDFYVNKTNSKGILITTNQQGKLVYITSSGLLRFTDFGNFSPNHFFLYEDFDGNNTKDFIFVDGKKLTIFDRFKKVIFSYTFQADITIKPAFFNIGRNKKVLGIVSGSEQTIYLFDKKGNTVVTKGLAGELPFTITSLKNNKTINLVTGAGNTLFNYKIQ